MRPFSIKIFVPSGDPEGVRVVLRDDWPGKAIVFPRELLGEVKGRREYQQPGVYLLSGGKRLYIGEGDPVGDRLDDHARKKPFWKKAIFFTAEGGRLNKAHVQHLESRLCALAKDAGLAELENGNQPAIPALSEEEYASAENFLREILIMLPLLGFWQFDDDSEEETEAAFQEEAEQKVASVRLGKRANLYSSLPRGMCFTFKSTAEAKAELELVDSGVIVRKGSQATLEVKQHFEIHGASYAAKRRELIESGVLQVHGAHYVFMQDQFFSSASAAASVIAGQNQNADHWVAASGENLGDLLRKARSPGVAP
ncbi:GIY-YIG nuclease family protein [Niveibacterium microcysteis]|uniref:GIY-YIG nuclease family protein n=1 Tax=Niveibacterium microcysteis TaxID=2811415 RepID=A0ABX7MBK6_9RHOO|nr:GIY-YIG nuclease family protein [Niveibacterium microcysteis]QSI78779.1 GIY-YIG nuclease family protein [Niveibacterium microcysteis]